MPVTLGDVQYIVRARLDALDASLREADRKLDAFRKRAEKPIKLNIRGGDGASEATGGGGGGGGSGTGGGAGGGGSSGGVASIVRNYSRTDNNRSYSRTDNNTRNYSRTNNISNNTAINRTINRTLNQAIDNSVSNALNQIDNSISTAVDNSIQNVTYNIRNGGAGGRGPGGGRAGGLRLGRLSQVATAYFAIREVTNLAEGVAMQRNPLLNQSAQQTLQTQQQSIAKISSGLLGGVASGAISGLDTLSILGGANANPAKAAGGFGVLGKFSPYALESAAFGADRGIKQAQTGDSILAQRRSAELTADNLEAERGNILERNPFNNRQNATATEAYNAQESLKAKDADLSNRLQTARTFKNYEEVDNLSRELGELRHEAPRLRKDIKAKANAEDKITGEDADLYYANLNSANEGTRLRQAGRTAESKQQEVNAQFGAQFDEKGNLKSLNNLTAKDGQLFTSQKTAYDLALRGVASDEEKRGYLASGAIKSAELALGRDPLGAQIAEIDAQRSAFNATHTDQKAFEVVEQNRLFDLEQNRAKQRYADQTKLIDIGLGSESRQIAAGLRRDRIGAEVAGTVGSGESRAESLRQVGRLGAAGQSLQNTIGQLQLLKQNYLDAFRGQSINLRTTDISNPRDVENPTAVLKEISDGIDELNNTMKNLATN